MDWVEGVVRNAGTRKFYYVNAGIPPGRMERPTGLPKSTGDKKNDVSTLDPEFERGPDLPGRHVLRRSRRVRRL